jgi:hypothetical protein
VADTKLTGLTELSSPALGDWLYQVDISDTTDDAAGSSRKLTNERLAGFFNPSICNGRLTTESGVPVSTSDRTAQSTIYFTPFNGNRIALYDGTRWKLYTFTERSLALSGLTSGKNYDVFIYDNAGTLTLELSAAWTDDNTPADAITTQDGISVKSGALTRRWIGTIRTTGTTTTEDSESQRFVWNLYNQVPRKFGKAEADVSHTYGTASFRNFNNTTDTQSAFVSGQSQSVMWCGQCKLGTTSAGTGINAAAGLSINGNDIDRPQLQMYGFNVGVYIGGSITVELPCLTGYNTLILREIAHSGTGDFQGGSTYGRIFG